MPSPPIRRPLREEGVGYRVGIVITWVIIFACAWIYCIASYGFVLGLGLGWLPAIIAATVFCWFWPVYAIGGAVLLLVLLLPNHVWF